MVMSWFSVNWNFCRLEFSKAPTSCPGEIAASYREGLSRLCQTLSIDSITSAEVNEAE